MQSGIDRNSMLACGKRLGKEHLSSRKGATYPPARRFLLAHLDNELNDEREMAAGGSAQSLMALPCDFVESFHKRRHLREEQDKLLRQINAKLEQDMLQVGPRLLAIASAREQSIVVAQRGTKRRCLGNNRKAGTRDASSGRFVELTALHNTRTIGVEMVGVVGTEVVKSVCPKKAQDAGTWKVEHGNEDNAGVSDPTELPMEDSDSHKEDAGVERITTFVPELQDLSNTQGKERGTVSRNAGSPGTKVHETAFAQVLEAQRSTCQTGVGQPSGLQQPAADAHVTSNIQVVECTEHQMEEPICCHEGEGPKHSAADNTCSISFDSAQKIAGQSSGTDKEQARLGCTVSFPAISSTPCVAACSSAPDQGICPSELHGDVTSVNETGAVGETKRAGATVVSVALSTISKGPDPEPELQAQPVCEQQKEASNTPPAASPQFAPVGGTLATSPIFNVTDSFLKWVPSSQEQGASKQGNENTLTAESKGTLPQGTPCPSTKDQQRERTEAERSASRQKEENEELTDDSSLFCTPCSESDPSTVPKAVTPPVVYAVRQTTNIEYQITPYR